MRKERFDRDWFYCDVEEGLDAFAPSPEMTPVALPHDAMIMRERKAGIPGGPAAGQYENKNTVYEKHFFVPDHAEDQKYFIEFEGIYANSTVFLNGNYIGGAHYGYSDFCLDATDMIIKGGDNHIQVNTKTGMGMLTRWYTGDGIYRSAWLYTGGRCCFVPGSASVFTQKIDEDSAYITLFGQVIGRESCLTLRAEVIDAEGNVSVCAEDIPVDQNGDYHTELMISGVSLWSADLPYLYEMKLTLLADDQPLDSEDFSFGVRTVEVKPEQGLLINGESVKLRGGCVHHDNGILGAMEFDDAALRRIRILKEAGYNAIRSAHNPVSKSLLKACDELGMYVMEESFDVWNLPKTEYDFSIYFDDSWECELSRMVWKDFNHPSVIMYAIGNEIQNLDTPYGVCTNRKLAEFVRSLDPTRPVTNAVNGMFIAMAHMGEILHDVLGEEGGNAGPLEINQVMTALDTHMDEIMCHRYITEMLDPISQDLDLVGYNYMGGRYEKDAAAYPRRVIVGSETRPDSIAANWERVKKLPNVVGDFVWTAWDYIGESGIGRVDFENPDSPMYADFPWFIAYTGDIDICGNRRPASYYRQIIWGLRDKPYIAVHRPQNIGKRAHTSNWSWSDSVHSWTWPGYEGKPVIAEIYSDAEEIELFLNDKSLGKKTVGEEKAGMARFPLAYEPGTLRAVAYSQGEPCSEEILCTAGADTQLKVLLSEEEVGADPNRVIFADILITDAAGTIDMSQSRTVGITVDGPLALIGFGSADPKSTEYFFETVRTTYDGRLLAAFRVKDEDGEAVIRVSSEGLGTAVKTVMVRS